MSDEPSVADFLEGRASVEVDREHEPNRNKHGIRQRCRYCGKDFETRSRKRNFELNVHESDCGGDGDE
jgi:hypothetical protein